MEHTEEQLREVCRAFRIPGKLVRWSQLKNGNINITYRVACFDGVQTKEYLVQRVNVYVYKDPVCVMRNIDMICSHMMSRSAQSNERRSRLHFHHTAQGKNFYVDQEGENAIFWRLSNFIEDSVSFDESADSKVLRMAGKAFGRFERQLSDFDANKLAETIPHFHDTRWRLEQFFRHVEEDPCGRCAEVQPEIAQIRTGREAACALNRKIDSGELPIRVTHNDTKTNNVLFDKETLEPVVVIDLDTVMPGVAAFDFGDAVRFAANRAAEDEPDTSKVCLDLDLFHAFAEGYIGETAGFLTPAELESMAQGAVIITFELATRFLDDYICGDPYFKINYPTHNLVRARSQLALYEDMKRKYPEMDRIVREVAEKARKTETESL